MTFLVLQVYLPFCSAFGDDGEVGGFYRWRDSLLDFTQQLWIVDYIKENYINFWLAT